ncbi:hypothetical protein BX666DRAFT_1892068, partial [Dichotomocladium elegans]
STPRNSKVRYAVPPPQTDHNHYKFNQSISLSSLTNVPLPLASIMKYSERRGR